MKYNVGDKVRIKSLDWYNKNKDEDGYIDYGTYTFFPCMSKFCGKTFEIAEVYSNCYNVKEVCAKTLDWTDEMIEELVEEGTKPKFKVGDRIISDVFSTKDDKGWEVIHIERTGYKLISVNNPSLICDMDFKNEHYYKLVEEEIKSEDMGEVSDGYHTFNELYEYRMLYNAALFNEFAKQGLYDVHKSRKHSDGEYPFGDSNWFIVMAELPTGQISNHYEMKDWNKFQIPEKPLANKWDEHSPKDVAKRLTSFTNPKKEYPKTYEECENILGLEDSIIEGCLGYEYKLLNAFQKLLMCRDAYWKIAGEEMGLGKPWELSIGTPIYYIYYNRTIGTIKNGYADDIQGNVILAFPTEEMRDAFKENFDPDIEFCKEFL